MSAATWERLYQEHLDTQLLDYPPEDWVVQTALRVHRRGLWLDVGSGDGRHAIALSSPERPVVAIDAATSCRFRHAVADAAALPVRSAAAELVLCTDVLSLLPDPLTALRELRRVCIPGGYIIVTLQTTDDETAKLGVAVGEHSRFWRRQDLGPYAVTFYTLEGIADLVRRSGLQMCSSSVYARIDSPHPHMQFEHRHVLAGLLLLAPKDDGKEKGRDRGTD